MLPLLSPPLSPPNVTSSQGESALDASAVSVSLNASKTVSWSTPPLDVSSALDVVSVTRTGTVGLFLGTLVLPLLGCEDETLWGIALVCVAGIFLALLDTSLYTFGSIRAFAEILGLMLKTKTTFHLFGSR